MGSNRQEGRLGNIQVKSYIPKSKFYNIFDAREDLSLNIQNMRKIHLLDFQYNDCGKNLWKFLGACLLVPYHQNIIE